MQRVAPGGGLRPGVTCLLVRAITLDIGFRLAAIAVVTCRIRSYHSHAEHLQRHLSWAAEIAGKVR
jgi:hypothetical protein